MSSSISFINILYFSKYRSSTLVKFTPRYFIIFDAILNDIVFLIFLSDSSLVCRNATDFCILILYPATLLNSFFFLNSSLVEFLGFSIYSMISPANNDSFTSLPICMFFIYFSCLIAVVRTSNTILNKMMTVGILVLFLILEKKFSAFHHWICC